MVRLCLTNTINKDLEFTAETASEFGNSRLPTLDFELWLENDRIQHHYFQKAMKTPFVVMKRSAMAQTQKMSILANEVVRRLSNTNHRMSDKSEILEGRKMRRTRETIKVPREREEKGRRRSRGCKQEPRQ